MGEKFLMGLWDEVSGRSRRLRNGEYEGSGFGRERVARTVESAYPRA
jgi:hypothetical protein